MISKHRICRTRDGRICLEDDPEATFVVVTPGHKVPDEFEADVRAFYEGHGWPVDDRNRADGNDPADQPPEKAERVIIGSSTPEKPAPATKASDPDAGTEKRESTAGKPARKAAASAPAKKAASGPAKKATAAKKAPTKK